MYVLSSHDSCSGDVLGSALLLVSNETFEIASFAKPIMPSPIMVRMSPFSQQDVQSGDS